MKNLHLITFIGGIGSVLYLAIYIIVSQPVYYKGEMFLKASIAQSNETADILVPYPELLPSEGVIRLEQGTKYEYIGYSVLATHPDFITVKIPHRCLLCTSQNFVKGSSVTAIPDAQYMRVLLRGTGALINWQSNRPHFGI